MATLVRSAAFNAAFYLATVLILILGAPGFLFLPQQKSIQIVRFWGWLGTQLLRILAGVRVEIRGREHMPKGAALIAAKHQSAFDTFALLPLFPDPTYVMKRELKWLPLFGHYTVRTGMIHVDRDRGPAALKALAARAGEEAAKGRQVIIFPEGTRRPPGAPPDYKPGVALLYRALKLPVTPVALNSGLYWPRRKFIRHPGTIVIEFLPPIPAGLETKTFLARLEETIETASDRLLVEAARAPDPPPLPPEADAKLRAPQPA